MSSVERALKKLRDAQGRGQPEQQRPLAQVERRADASQTGEQAAIRLGMQDRSVRFDLDALKGAGLYAEGNRALAEQYRVIKRPLLRKAAATGPESVPRANLVAVTSAVANEGKTFTAVNLALSLTSEKDWEVVLVDADCKNPQLSRLLGAADEVGLLDLLKERSAGIESVVMPTNIRGLSLLPLGHQDDHAAELLGSARMDEICDALCRIEPRKIVILDTSPLLLTSESAVACAHAGQVVIVVKSDQTAQHAVLEAIGKLDQSKTIGLVLNCASEISESYPYGSYSSYPAAAGEGVHEF